MSVQQEYVSPVIIFLLECFFLYTQLVAIFFLFFPVVITTHKLFLSYFSNIVMHYVFINAPHKPIKVLVLLMANFSRVIINAVSKKL